MTDRENRPIIGGSGGNASGTGGGESELEADVRTRPQSGSAEGGGQGLSAGDDSVDDAIGGDPTVSVTGGAPAHSGRSSSEGNANTFNSPDAGDPGGMSGAGVSSGNPQGRPPGGVGPIDPQESSKD